MHTSFVDRVANPPSALAGRRYHCTQREAPFRPTSKNASSVRSPSVWFVSVEVFRLRLRSEGPCRLPRSTTGGAWRSALGRDAQVLPPPRHASGHCGDARAAALVPLACQGPASGCGCWRSAGHILPIDTVCRKHGHPELVYCCWGDRLSQQLLHEIELTELCLRIHAGEIRRGARARSMRGSVPMQNSSSTASDSSRSTTRGTMGIAQIQERFSLYEGCPDLVLWVCPTEARCSSPARARAAAAGHCPVHDVCGGRSPTRTGRSGSTMRGGTRCSAAARHGRFSA